MMHSKLQQAALLHNKALIYKKKTLQNKKQQHYHQQQQQQPNKQQQRDCLDAIAFYQKALQLYQECHLGYYSSRSSSIITTTATTRNSSHGEDDYGNCNIQQPNDHNHDNQNNVNEEATVNENTTCCNIHTAPLTIHLELKIAQTHQSLAKLYKILHQEEDFIQAHEDVLSFLLQEQQRVQQMGEKHDHDNNKQEQEEEEEEDKDHTTKQSRSVGTNSSKNNNSSVVSSPTSVMDLDAHSNSFSSSSSSSSSSPTSSSLLFDNIIILPLTIAERTRIMSFSLNALGHLYFEKERCITGGDDLMVQQPQYQPPESSQDAMRYYEISLNLLVSVEQPVCITKISSLSHKRTVVKEKNGKSVIVYYWMDLKRDVLLTLWEMAGVRQYRREYLQGIRILCEARDWIQCMTSLSSSSTSALPTTLASSSSLDSFVRHMEEMVESELARTYVQVQDWNKAYMSYQHVLSLRKEMFGENSMEVGHVYQSLSDLNQHMGDLGQSLGWNKRAVEIYSNGCSSSGGSCGGGGGWKHLVGSLKNQGGVYVQMGEVEKAIETYWRVLEIQKQYKEKVGAEGVVGSVKNMASTWTELGNLYKSNGRWREAKSCYQQALKLWNNKDEIEGSKDKKDKQKKKQQQDSQASLGGYSFQGEDDDNQDFNEVSVLESLCQVEMMMLHKKETSLSSQEKTTHSQHDVARYEKEQHANGGVELETHVVHRQQQQQHESSSYSSPPSHLPFRPPVAQASSKQKESKSNDCDGGDDNLRQEEQNQYCRVVETRPFLYLESGDNDDDAVSQITFLTSQLESPSTSGLTYKTLEKKLEHWSPAEYVFQAVDKIAIATEEFAQELFSGGRKSKKLYHKRLSQRGHSKKILQDIDDDSVSQEEDEDEYDVREVTCQESRSSPSQTNTFGKSIVAKHLDYGANSATAMMQSMHNAPVNSRSAISVPYMKPSRQTDKLIENDVSSYSSKMEDTSYINADDSIAASTVFGSLVGTNFVSDGSIGGTTQTSTLFGTKYIDSDSVSKPAIYSDKTHSTKHSNSSSTLDMDELLAQLNVVTCDANDTRTFEEVLKSESNDDLKQARARHKRNKAFEKISACLGALDELVDEYGPEHSKVIDKLDMLAALYLGVGNIDKGLLKYRQVLDLQKKKYGKHSSQVCNTHVKLGNYFAKEEEYDKAIHNFALAKETDEHLHGSNHPKVAHHLNRMGTVELDRNHFDQAMDYFHTALQIQQMYLGPNEINPDLSLTYANIGSVYYKEHSQPNCRLRSNLYKNFIESGMLEKVAFAHSERGEYMKAIHFYSEILDRQRQRNDGGSVTNIVATYCCLAELKVKLGRCTEAMEHYNLSLNLVENSNKSKDVDIWTIKSDIAVVEYHLGNFDKASKILETAFTTQRKFLGKHPRVAKTMYHLGVIKRIQYERKTALSFLNGALKIQLSTIGQHHPDTILTQIEISKVLFDWYEFDESIRKLTTILNVQYVLLGNMHPDISGTLHLLGVCFAKMNNDKMAIKYFEKCYRMQLKVLDFDCPAVASTKDELASIFVQQGKLDKANQLLQDSIRIRRQIHQEHYEVAFSLYNMGHYSIARCMYSDALNYFKESLTIAIQAFGTDHPFVGDIHVGLGLANTRQCHFEVAKHNFQAALEIYDKCKLSKIHPRVTKCQEKLSRVAHEEDLCV